MFASEVQDEPSPLSSGSGPASASSCKENKTTTTGTTHGISSPAFAASAPASAPAPTERQQQPPRKRRRIVISCTECHRRKQKCDRRLPCANCVARNKQDSCRYDTAAPTIAGGGRSQQQQQQQQQQQAEGVVAAGDDEDGGALSGPAVKQRRPRTSKYDVDVGVVAGAAAAAVPGVGLRQLAAAAAAGEGGGVEGSGGGGSGGGAGAMDANFGYSAAGASTLGLMKRIDDDEGEGGDEAAAGPLTSLAMAAAGTDATAYFGTRERYKSLVRQLPARPYIEKLVDVYFKEINWQYCAVDHYVFDRQMDEWYSLPFHVLNTEGPQAFPPDLRAFPALVFQMIGTALLMLGPGSDPTFDSLKYNTSMTFEDLATDYSESGVALLDLLGKRNISHTAVIADWMRAGFLKYSGLVTESWHAIGTAIRDAQEAGLHRDSLDPKPKSDNLEDILENQWEIQRRRKTWCLLMVWDVHTGVILSRPINLDLSVPYTLPIDAPTPKDPARTPVTQRTEDEPPSLMTRTLYVYRVTIALHDIVELEKEGPYPKDFSKVDRLHEKMLELEAQTPAYFRKQNPDTRYDDMPECFWIPLVRSQLHPLVWFNFMALHRPYIFTRPHSRLEALKASFKMLEAQRENFASMHPRHHRTFQLFFGTFDAVVLMASIFILFPKDNADYAACALQHFQWAVERFETMSERNRLAAAARGVLHGLHARLKKALGVIGSAGPCSASPAVACSSKETPTLSIGTTKATSNTQNAASGTSPSLDSSGGTRTSSIFTPTPGGPESSLSSLSVSEHYFNSGETPIDPSLSGGGVSAPAPPQLQPQQSGSEWALPDDFDWASIQPVYAMADVAYHDLMGINNGDPGAGGASVPKWTGGAPDQGGLAAGDGDAQEWSFGGAFGSDSVWSVLNQFPAEFRG